MSRTPEKLKNKTAETIRNILICVGIAFGFITLAGIQNGGSFIIPLLVSIAAFVAAANIKVIWKKDTEVSRYK